MTPVSQNYQEALLALEQLESLLEGSGFRREVQKTEALLQNMTLSAEEKEPLQARLEALKQKQQNWRSEHSSETKSMLEGLLADIERQLELPADSANWEQQRNQLNEAQNLLDQTMEKLKAVGRELTKADEDECWQAFKQLRRNHKRLRQQISQDLATSAENLLQEAKAAVADERSLRRAREIFKESQSQVNQMPLWRETRQRFQQAFNELWKELQLRSREQREASQQRQEAGLQKLEDALSRVELLLERKREDLHHHEERMQEAHWNEVDPLERQQQRLQADVADAERRQQELQAKIADARNRLGKKSKPATESATEGAEEQTETTPETELQASESVAVETTAEAVESPAQEAVS